MIQYLQVAEDLHDSPMELPSEDDGTLLLSTLSAQFPGACGLKYRNEETGNLRGLRLMDGRIHPATEVWGTNTYYVVYPKENKRKGDDSDGVGASKMKRGMSSRQCSDLIVLGLPYNCEKEMLTTYFSEYGTLLMAEVKKDPKTGAGRGYGFIRFAEYEAQVKVLTHRHTIGSRQCDVKIPNSKEGSGETSMSRKIFVGRVTEEMTSAQLREYFEKFGEVMDVYIPSPFRAFAFVTFTDPNVASMLCGEDHIIASVSCHISSAVPKGTKEKQQQQHQQQQSSQSGYGSYMGTGQSWAPDSSRGGWGGSGQGSSGAAGPQANQQGAAAGMNNMMSSMMSNPAFLAAAFAASQGMFGGGMGGGAAPAQQAGGQAANSQMPVPPPPPSGQAYGTAAANGAQRWAPETDASKAAAWPADPNATQQWR